MVTVRKNVFGCVVCRRLRDAIYHVAELEGGKLSGEIEIDESYFGRN